MENMTPETPTPPSAMRPSKSISRREFLRNTVDIAAASAIFPIIPFFTRIHAEKEIYKLGVDKYFNFYEPLKPFPVKGSNLQIVGVAHTRETYLANAEDIRARVQRAPFVIFEAFYDSIRKRSLPTVAMDQKMNDLGDNDTGVQFFSGIGRICVQEGKDVVVVNPGTLELLAYDLALLTFVPSAVTLDAGASLVQSLRGRRMTRRRFLRHVLMSNSALVLASWAGFTRKLRSSLEKDGLLSAEMPEEEQTIFLWKKLPRTASRFFLRQLTRGSRARRWSRQAR